MTYTITLHGVLQQSNGAPNPQGHALYAALCGVGRVVILGGLDREKDEWFLATNNFITHADYLPELIEKHPTELGRRRAQIGLLRAGGTHIELSLEPDPEIVAALHADGIPTLLYLHPRFTNPAFRPDYESVARPWNELIETVRYQDHLKASAVIPTEDEK